MRKGFEGLYGLVRERLLCEPLSGHFFLFCNAPRNRLKVLVWDGTGLRPRLPLTVRDEVLFSPFVQQRSAVQTAAKTFCQG